MVQNLRACFILLWYHNEIVKCIQEKIEFPSMLQRPRLISTTILGDLSMAAKIKQQKATIENCKKSLRGGKKMASCCPGGHLPPLCLPMATGLLYDDKDLPNSLSRNILDLTLQYIHTAGRFN